MATASSAAVSVTPQMALQQTFPNDKLFPVSKIASNVLSHFEDTTFSFTGVLGSGSFGLVLLATNGTGKQVACKIAKTSRFDPYLEQESVNLNRLNQLDPLHTAKRFHFLSAFFGRDNCKRNVLLEEYGGFSLSTLCQKQNKITISDIAHITSQLILFWSVLAREHLVLRDLKPDNIVVSQGPLSRPGSVKVIDTAYLYQVKEVANVYETTRYYRSPTVYTGEIHAGENSFPIGATVYQLFVGRCRFPTEVAEEPMSYKIQRHLHMISCSYKPLSAELITKIGAKQPDLVEYDDNETPRIKKEFPADYYIKKASQQNAQSNINTAADERVNLEEYPKEPVLSAFNTLVDTLLDYENPPNPEAVPQLPFFGLFHKEWLAHQNPQQ